MAVLITNPISANQVVDVPIDMGCIGSVPCKNLPNVLQAITDKICQGLDVSDLEFGDCVTPGSTVPEVLQNIITSITCADGGEPGCDCPTNDIVLTGLTECSTDSWTCAQPDACFTLTNTCDPGVITLQVVLQALLDRNVAYGNVIKNQCAQISTLQSQVAALQLAVSNIQSSCCP